VNGVSVTNRRASRDLSNNEDLNAAGEGVSTGHSAAAVCAALATPSLGVIEEHSCSRVVLVLEGLALDGTNQRIGSHLCVGHQRTL